MRSWWIRGVSILTVLALGQMGFHHSDAAPASCRIIEGVGISVLQVGIPIAAALLITGPPVRQQAANGRVVYALRPPLFQMVADRGIIERVSTRSPECRTAGGAGPGLAVDEIRRLYATSPMSVLRPTPEGDLLSYPFAGVAFLLSRDRVEVVEVFRADSLGLAPAAPAAGPSPPTVSAPTGPPTATSTATPLPGPWNVRSTATRVEDSVLVVTGVVENRDRARNAYAEVRLLAPTGQVIAQGESPLMPSPVPVGGTATFEARIAVDQLVRRYSVFIRPFGAPSVTLAQASGEIKDLQQFAAMVARQLMAEVRAAAALPDRSGFVVVVTNGSPLAVESATVTVQMTVTCRVAWLEERVLVAAAPPPPPTPAPTPGPTPRTIQETWTGTAAVRSIGPRSSSETPILLSGGVCLAFSTWTASTRISDVRVAQ